jgi:hypothetical protein
MYVSVTRIMFANEIGAIIDAGWTASTQQTRVLLI